MKSGTYQYIHQDTYAKWTAAVASIKAMASVRKTNCDFIIHESAMGEDGIMGSYKFCPFL
jgi:hypothetical protein